MVILGGDQVQEVRPDPKAVKVFLKALDLAGGPRKLILYRNLTWIPSLLEAAYVVVLANEYNMASSQIASTLGITEQTVRNVLRADTDAVKARLQAEGAETFSEKSHVHMAGGLAKWAYEEIRKGNDRIRFLEEPDVEPAPEQAE